MNKITIIFIATLFCISLSNCKVKKKESSPVSSSAKETPLWKLIRPNKAEVKVVSEIPKEAPFPKSEFEIKLTGRFANYTKADTWYPSWASDGNLYSPWTDGSIAGEDVNSWSGAKARTGQAKIEGNDPLNLKVTSLGSHESSSLPLSLI